MWYKQDGEWKQATKKSVNLSSPSVIKAKREAFERKKLTKAFKMWRYKQYKTVQKGLCFYCHLPIIGAWTTDHIIPLSRGGTSAYKNMVICCLPCNKSKGVRYISTRT
jgi:5-methylcytosine-specific restriction endonuclease McrA